MPEGNLPWYRQFWPWFLIALPLSAVIAGVITVIIAVGVDDRLVQRQQHERFGPVMAEKQP